MGKINEQMSLDIKVINFDSGLDALRTTGFQIIRHHEWMIPAEIVRHWQALAKTWDDLPVDPYLKTGSAFRYRRFGRFILEEATGLLQRSEDQSFFQSSKINSYAGGVVRNFAPMHDLTYKNKFLHYIVDSSLHQLRTAFGVSSKLWEVTIHQFRIQTSENEVGLPTPEGVHRDGHKFISMHLIARKNVTGGITRIYTGQEEELISVTLLKPMDSILLHDEILKHGVTPIMPDSEPEDASYRDVIVIDYNLMEK